ncbi:hypothetical protein B0T13DRAFT_453737 [Neurospora crassa]|nr:hypothetical protein B0T13DRAFT_453737 [Neurospora crassa]
MCSAACLHCHELCWWLVLGLDPDVPATSTPPRDQSREIHIYTLYSFVFQAGAHHNSRPNIRRRSTICIQMQARRMSGISSCGNAPEVKTVCKS